MHLLAGAQGAVQDGSEAVDLGQTPADILVLSAADSDLACLAAAHDRLVAQSPDTPPSLRLANLLTLGHNLSVDLYVERMVTRAKLVIVRLLGGVRYWPYGVEQIEAACRDRGLPCAFLPGDDRPDPDLTRRSTLPPDDTGRLWRYFVHGGIDNAVSCLGHAMARLGHAVAWREPAPLPKAALYAPGLTQPSLTELRAGWTAGAPTAAVVFYRALLQAGNLAAVDALVHALRAEGLNPLPIAVASLKDRHCADMVAAVLDAAPPDVIINGTGFAVSTPGAAQTAGPFDAADCPVLQVIFSGGREDTWRTGTAGLAARDIAMNVAMPEVDGRLITRAVSFKAEATWHAATECSLAAYRPVPDRVAHVAALGAGWARLRHTPAATRRVALVLANYPNRDGRLANGVGLDTPASVAAAVAALAQDGYAVADAPTDGQALMARLTAGVTNDLTALNGRAVDASLPVSVYEDWFAGLPEPVRRRVTDRWGDPAADPFVADGRFRLPAHRFGHLAIAVQPARGYNIDPVRSYHDPALPPPHGYLAFHAWLRLSPDAGGFGAQAVVHFGKHGNLEWLPGKALALSAACFPDVALGPLPHLYPFIVNDPGEGSQAKRRTAAAVIDHMTPPLTRAGTYGPLRELEALIDEYFEAAGLDARRLPVLRDRILELAEQTGLDADCGIARRDDADEALTKLDAYLCELKDLQIRDGLHIFGQSPTGQSLTDLLVALVRLPRGRGEGGDASLLRALAHDLRLGFDPLAPDLAAAVPEGAGRRHGWRTQGDAVDGLEDLATALVAGDRLPDAGWTATIAVLRGVAETMRPAVDACGPAELRGLLRGLAGRFVPPGPSGAPSRGRPEVLPTGRNFYAVDPRAVPTPAAWTLGWRSAAAVVARYVQEHGDWPRSLALTAWGTANMRTGGDDLCQMLALLGVQPDWDTASGRVTGFTVMPAAVLDRPRVDVTLRISGFFRDAFPFQIDLVDSAVRAVAALDEPAQVNPLAARVARDRAALIAQGVPPEEADQRAGARVFGSKPGAYGAGLQALIDEGGWDGAADLAEAYMTWGSYAYGGGQAGTPDRAAFEQRLGTVDAVLHNQDNREHDLLDSDDYYQFEGGLAAAVRTVSGRAPVVYHNDHSRPETPRIRRLDEEIDRVVRARAVNPKWIAGVMRHGYKGAFEIAATVDYLFAFAATTGTVRDAHFDAVYDAYVNDDTVRTFMADANPAALREMAARLLDAQHRSLWRPRSNSAYDVLKHLADAAGATALPLRAQP